MEADLQMHCRLDFRDYYRGRMSLRRIAVMLRWMPDEAATVHIARDGWPAWGATEQVIDDLRRVYLASHGVKNPAPHEMSPLSASARRKAEADSVEIAQRWEQSRAREAQRQAWIKEQEGGG